MSEPVKVLPMAQLLRLAREKEERERSQSHIDSQPDTDRQLHSGRQSVSAPIKEKLLKENTKKEKELALDTKSCPDCQGSGFWYPEGVEKGVAKCKHEKLRKA